MLFTYHYPQNHQLEQLNEYLVDFLTTIRTIAPNAQFRPQRLLQPAFFDIVDNSPKLKAKLQAFFSAFKLLQQVQKEIFYQLVVKSQNIQSFFTDETIDCTDTMSNQIVALIGNNSFNILVAHLFAVTLKSLDIHDHYQTIYNSMPHKVCPFCGVEKMHKSFQEDYDHLAAKKHYPLVAINMRNLAPMCHTCNSKNKGEKDVLHNTDTTRRVFIYPYTQHVNVTIDFSNSVIPHTDSSNDKGNWNVNFIPDNNITQNWNVIFGIKKRYKEDYLEANFDDWLDDFLEGIIQSNVVLVSGQDVIDNLLVWHRLLESRKFYNSNFIKAPLFLFLSNCGAVALYSSIIVRYNLKRAA